MSSFVPEFRMLLANHMILTPLPGRKYLVAVQTVVTQLDLFMTVSQETFQIAKTFCE